MTAEKALQKTRQLKVNTALIGEKGTGLSIDYLNTVENMLEKKAMHYDCNHDCDAIFEARTVGYNDGVAEMRETENVSEDSDTALNVSDICKEPVYIGQQFCGKCGRKLLWKPFI